MKICLVGPTHPFRGGISHYTTVLCRELQKRHDVSLISLKKQYPKLLFPGQTQTDGSQEAFSVANEPLLVPWNPWTWRRAISRISSIEPALVVFQWWHPFFAPCFGSLARMLRDRRISTCFLVHNMQAHEHSPIHGVLNRFAFRHVPKFIVHSKNDESRLRTLRPGSHVEVTPHPTYECFQGSSAIPKEEARRKIGLPSRETILFFGYIRKYKGLPVLLRSMPRVLKERNVQLLVVGEFYHEEKEIRELIRDLRLREHVTLVDRYVPNEEVKEFFSASDAVVLPYHSASQSGIVQIAYGFQRPVIATRVGGLPEVIEDGVTGMLVPPGDPSSLAGAIVRFFAEGMGERMARNISRQEDRFSWDRMVEAIERLAGGIRSPAIEERSHALAR